MLQIISYIIYYYIYYNMGCYESTCFIQDAACRTIDTQSSETNITHLNKYNFILRTEIFYIVQLHIS